MNRAEIDEYRRSVESEYSNKQTQIETSTSYISTALIGFFVSASGKPSTIEKNEYLTLYIIGLVLLSSSLAIILFRKYVGTKDGLKLLDHISKMHKDDDIKMEKELYRIWDRTHKCSEKTLLYSFATLILGVIASGFYFFINL